MATTYTPDQVLDGFFKYLMQNQCHVSWALFSATSQAKFLDWTLDTLYNKNGEAAKTAKLTTKEVRMLLERNDSMLMKTFWKKFYLSSNAGDFYRFGYYSLLNQDGKDAQVQVEFRYPQGQIVHITVNMVFERNGWKLAYIESGLPF
jgi:hypothetical protein